MSESHLNPTVEEPGFSQQSLADESATKWKHHPDVLTLPDKTAHLWRIKLRQSESVRSRFWSILDKTEQARAKRFHFDKDRFAFIMARGALRAILGKYSGNDPAKIHFFYSGHGKPYTNFSPKLNFNLSHSGDYALLGLVREYNIGVDVELIRSNLATEDIATRYFSKDEAQVFRQLPENQKVEAFFNCWSRKEAVIKCDGRGLSLGLSEFDVTLSPDLPGQLIRASWLGNEVNNWRMCALSVDPDYSACLVVDGKIKEIETWEAGSSITT